MEEFESNTNFKELDNYFVNTLGDAKLEPSAAVWDTIEIKLDEKKKNRFLFWLIPGILFILVATICSYLYFPSNNSQSTKNLISKNKKADSKQQEKIILNKVKEKDLKTKESDINNATLTENKELANSSNKNKETELSNLSIKENNKVPLNPTSKKIKIQIAAFKNQNATLPAIVAGYEVSSYINKDGIKKYVIETTNVSEVDVILSRVKEAGYKGAFVLNYAANNNTFSNSNKDEVITRLQTNENDPAKEKEPNAATDQLKENKPKEPVAEISKTNKKSITPIVSQETNTIPIANTDTQPSNSTTIAANTFTTSIESKQPEPKNNIEKQLITAKTDSTQQSKQPANNKIDTVKALPTKPMAKADTSLLPFKRFGIYVLAGPTIAKQILNSTEIPLIKTMYNLKLCYLLTKKIGVEAEINYQNIGASQSEKELSFQKNLTNTTFIPTSYGDLAVDPATLMDGFSPMAPIPTFTTKYSYQIIYQAINIPLTFKFYPVKKDKLSVSAFAGLSTQKIISQTTTLTFYKESFTNVLNYNSTIPSKINFSLLFGLGCELKLYKNMYFVAEPRIRYGLSNMNSSSPARSKVLYLDGSAGIKISF